MTTIGVDNGKAPTESASAGWRTVRLKTLIESARNGVWGSEPLNDGSDTLCIRVADFNREQLIVIEEPTTYRQIAKKDIKGRIVRSGDLLLEKSGGGDKTLVGMAVQYRGEELAVCSNFVSVVRTRKGVLESWLNYLLFSLYSRRINYRSIKQSTGIQNLDAGQYFDERVPLPSYETQIFITHALDRETARIDALIEKKTRFIELLKEKRQALITQAVTKGLDPTVPMKDSGVEWIGEVPAHWDVISIGYILDAVGDVDHFMPASVEKGVPYLMTGDLKEFASGVNFEKCKQVSYRDYSKLCKRIKSSKGDVIIARYATIGTSMYVDIDVDFLVSYSCVTIKTIPSMVSGLYLFQYLKSNAFYQGIENQINTNTQGNVGINDLKKVKLAVPGLPEQSRIIEYLQSKLENMDKLTEKTQSSIELLKERRSALITAAVTGQIDLREDAA